MADATTRPLKAAAGDAAGCLVQRRGRSL